MANLAIAAALVALGCAGSTGARSYAVAITADDLEGKWCDARPNHLLCLEVYGPPGAKSYAFLASDCSEVGVLSGARSGALDFRPYRFNPDGSPLCFIGEPARYSVSALRTDQGLSLTMPGETIPLDLSYVERKLF